MEFCTLRHTEMDAKKKKTVLCPRVLVKCELAVKEVGGMDG